METPRTFISQRAHNVDASGIRKVFDLAAKMKNPINLSIGLPDFDVPEIAKQAAAGAINAGHNRYTQTQGIAPLRQRLRADLSNEFSRDVGEVLITSGVSGALLLAILAVVDPGDEVIFLDPYFVMYKHLLTMAGGKSVIVDSYPDFRFDPDRVEKVITPRTKMLILNSPSNPTGIVMSEPEIRSAVDLARKHNLLILSDEIYEPFLYESGKWKVESGETTSSSPLTTLYSPLSLYENTLVVRGFSKSHAMTGWRVGYAFGPAEVVAQMTKLQQYTFVCAPSPFQEAALAALDVDMSAHVADYRRKRDIAYSMLSAKFEIEKPGGAFYIFPKAPARMTASAFVERAIAANVLIIPGNVFSERDTHFRISYATSDDTLRRGCEILLSLV
ncbi:MAG: aminotransferase class I/II-fold pyridoxal phosphate-dependent enzyme [Burkholderiales bacterium]|nr:aminotransferase class I/II-fold pyridoxal phosphate-dependent enzyme [Phycisphaerae bacterium]